MKRTVYLGLMVALLSGLSACTSYDYYTAAINKTNLSNYHTFAWMPPAAGTDSKMNGGVADAKIKDAATNDLTMKGLRLSQRNPDLVVNYTTKVGTGSRTNYYSPYYGFGGYPGFGFGLGYGWGGWGYRGYYNYFGGPFSYYGGVTYAEKEHYKEGTLIIDLIDRRTRKIVWRGFGVGEVHNNPEKTIEDLPKVVDGVLAQLQLGPDQVRMRRS